MMSNPSSKNVYQKRLENSIPAPIENDSEDDPDFIAGAYIPEEKPKKKRRSKGSSAQARKRRRTEVLSDSSDSASSKRQSTFQKGSHLNPLHQYFGDVMDMPSSEDEEEHVTDDEKNEEADSDEDGLFPVLSTMTAAVKPKSGGISPTRRVLQNKKLLPNSMDIDSVTESESDDDNLLKYGSSKINTAAEESVTESETEPESDPDQALRVTPNPPTYVMKSILKPNQTSATSRDSSVTESESEDEETILSLAPRPNFHSEHKQKIGKSYMLDERKQIKIPATINSYLREYQREGVTFLYRQYKEERGGLLGDDMGLVSKTIQVISFLSAIMYKTGTIRDKRRRRNHVHDLMDEEDWKVHKKLPKANAKWPTCLIIAPSTVVHNWKSEFKKWGYFEVGIYTGKNREQVLQDFKYGRLDVVITSFTLASRDIDYLDSLAWSCIIVDEVHHVKNATSKIADALHRFACPRRFGLSGTTIQNSYKEMWAILDWTNPGKLGSAKQWDTYVAKPLTTGQSTGATEEERSKSLLVAKILKEKLLPNFFLRRTKDIIKDQLPKKFDHVVFCPLTSMQIHAYKRILNMEAVQNFINRDQPCPCGSKKARKKCCHPFVVGDVFKYMAVLIKLSNHLALILPGNPKDSPEQIARNRELASAVFPNGNTPIYELAFMEPQFCGKWAALEVLLSEWRKDRTNKVLIFTKSVKLLDTFEHNLRKKEETGYKYLRMDGETPQKERMPMIEKFNTDPSINIFLISIQTGGTGLNLTGANKVVIFDPNWNPAHDLQAMDRAFRFGQTRDVSVYRLLGAGSLEELIYARQIYKQQQMAIGYNASVQTRYFEGVQGDNAKKGELFGLENIFKLHEDKLATKQAIEKANLAELDWALANLNSGPKKGKHTGKSANEFLEASGKVQSDDFLGSAKGLGALLFDDAAPQTEHDVIQRTLNAIGVSYSHMNDEILVPSKIEEARTKELIKKTRQKRNQAAETKKTKKGKEKEPSPPKDIWPPIRKHHKLKPPPPTPEEQLQLRRKALIRLELIKNPQDVPSFARDFAKMTEEEQTSIIASLDEYMANNPASDSDSSS